MNKKALMKFGGITIASIFLVSFILITLKPVSPGTSKCVILPDTKADRDAYSPGCDRYTGACPVKVDLNGDGDYKDPGEGPGVAGCDCAENNFCTPWCQNDICDWESGITVAAAVCNIETAMPHCTGAVACPAAGGPCKGSTCGLIPAGGCCMKDSNCVTYSSGGSPKCTITATADCYSWTGVLQHAPTLTENMGWKCDCANTGEPCGLSTDCCDSNDVCLDSVCTTSGGTTSKGKSSK